MIAEVLQPLVSELPINEKRRLLEWLKSEVDEKPANVVGNTKLRNALIKHITKKSKKNGTTNNHSRVHNNNSNSHL